jgi:hypothetical protein
MLEKRIWKFTLQQWLLAGTVLASLLFHLAGLRQELPYLANTDEPSLLIPAVDIVSTGNLDPGWYGNPGSTVIYPLAGMIEIYYELSGRNPSLLEARIPWATGWAGDTLWGEIWKLYLMGRLMVAFYDSFLIIWIFLSGKRVFGAFEGLVGAGFYAICLAAISHAQVIRTDAPAVFWGTLSLWLIAEIYHKPSTLNQLAAGICIGLSISSRYFMAALIPVLFMVDILVIIRSRDERKKNWGPVVLGLLAAPIFFALSTPYFILSFDAAIASLLIEARPSHIGADGFLWLGNLSWYISLAIPLSITWGQFLFAVAGAAETVIRKQPMAMVLLGYATIFLTGISISYLHWQRWIIPILPVLVLFAAHGIRVVIDGLFVRLKWPQRYRQQAILLVIIILAVKPTFDLILHDIRANTPSTRLLAQQWLLKNIPTGSKIAGEAYSIYPTPPENGRFRYTSMFSLSEKPFEEYYNEGYRYLVVSSGVYNRFLAEPERYQEQIIFYERLSKQGRLLFKIEPTRFHTGPVIQAYKLSPPISP